MPVSRTKNVWKSLAGAALAAALVVAPLVSTGATAAGPGGQVGTVGTPEDFTPASNSTDYWEKRYAAHQADCYKVDNASSSNHGTVSQDKKTLTLKPFQQSWPGDHWEVLVIKGGTVNMVVEHPAAGVAYASPMDGKNQKEISHWIVCKGTTPETAPLAVTPSLEWTLPSCTAAGELVKSDNVLWSSTPGDNGSTIWTASAPAGKVLAKDVKFQWTVPNLAKLGLDIEACRPDQPEPTQTSKDTLAVDCTSKTVTITTTTTTTPYVWVDLKWVLGESKDVVTTSERPMTADEKRQDCELPDTTIEYDSWVDGEWNCGDTTVTQTREVTTTVYEYDAEGEPAAKSSVAIETQTRDLTQSEIAECPLLPGEIVSSCVGDVPYLAYGVTLPEGYTPDSETPVTITFVNPDGDDYVVQDQPLTGSLLWPGASATEPKMWPGWELVDGEYFPTAGNFAWTREGVTVRFDVNPTYETAIEYPAATELCANPANLTPGVGGEDPETPVVDGENPETPGSEEPASTGTESSGPLAVTGGGVSPLVPIAGGALLLMGVAALFFVAYQRRSGARTP